MVFLWNLQWLMLHTSLFCINFEQKCVLVKSLRTKVCGLSTIKFFKSVAVLIGLVWLFILFWNKETIMWMCKDECSLTQQELQPGSHGYQKRWNRKLVGSPYPIKFKFCTWTRPHILTCFQTWRRPYWWYFLGDRFKFGKIIQCFEPIFTLILTDYVSKAQFWYKYQRKKWGEH